MNLLAYTQTFAQDLKTGAIYKKPLNPQEQIFHRAIGNLLDKAIGSGAAVELAGDILLELLGTKQQTVELQKKIEELQKPAEPKQQEQPQEQAVEEPIEQAA